ncbi:MAG: hypothetical protein JKY56_20570 [Kofleriaceae bacterium]|nr:hypothetical protein [Kofleriaceae bacterium]
MTLWTRRDTLNRASNWTSRLGYMALSCLWVAACGDVVADPDAAPIDAPPPTGTFSLDWTIVDGINNLSCNQVGALALSVRLVTTGGSIGSAEAFSCAGGRATSRGISPGNYQFSIDLLASGNRSLLDGRIIVPNIEIVPNGNTELPMQTFEVSSIGRFLFTVTGGASGGNCESAANSGAGIVGVDFQLRDSMGGCVPSEFVVSQGSGSGGTYTSDCGTQRAASPCILSDQEIRVMTPAGSYQLVVTAQKAGPIDCYSKAANFVLPGAGLESDLGQQTLALEFSQDCDPNFVAVDAGVQMTDAGVSDASL